MQGTTTCKPRIATSCHAESLISDSSTHECFATTQIDKPKKHKYPPCQGLMHTCSTQNGCHPIQTVPRVWYWQQSKPPASSQHTMPLLILLAAARTITPDAYKVDPWPPRACCTCTTQFGRCSLDSMTGAHQAPAPLQRTIPRHQCKQHRVCCGHQTAYRQLEMTSQQDRCRNSNAPVNWTCQSWETWLAQAR